MDTIQIVKDYYDTQTEGEYNRIANRPEFLLTCRFIDRYVKPGDSVIDIGGGPGRYSLYLKHNGCDVTLFDLSPANVEFANRKAEEQGVKIKTVCGDARYADTLVSDRFDHVLLMGPMYHLLDEADRIKAVKVSINVLKPGGTLFVSFINMIAGMIYAMKYEPAIILDEKEEEFYKAVFKNESYAGQAFTQAFLIAQHEVLPFMKRFPLEKLHFFGQEGITSPCENNIMSQSPEVVDRWLDFCEKICEREELLSWSEHLMYVGRKI